MDGHTKDSVEPWLQAESERAERGVGDRGGVVGLGGRTPGDCEGPCCAQCQPLCTRTG